MAIPQLPSGVLEITRQGHGAVTVLVVAGELDMATTPQLSETLDGLNGNGPIVLDLRDLTFIDSHGLHALLTRAETHDLTLARPHSNVVRLLALTDGRRLLRIHETLEAALTAVQDDDAAHRGGH